MNNVVLRSIFCGLLLCTSLTGMDLDYATKKNFTIIYNGGYSQYHVSSDIVSIALPSVKLKSGSDAMDWNTLYLNEYVSNGWLTEEDTYFVVETIQNILDYCLYFQCPWHEIQHVIMKNKIINELNNRIALSLVLEL